MTPHIPPAHRPLTIPSGYRPLTMLVQVGIPDMLPYCASKFALEGLTATMAAELRGAGIRVNSFSPGMVDTRTFPKAPGRPGVRPAEGVRAALLSLCCPAAGAGDGFLTGRYVHADELDAAVAAGAPPEAAAKAIDEPAFVVPAPASR